MKLEEATISNSPRHIEKYTSHFPMEYTVAKKHGDISAGSKVTAHGIFKDENGGHHATISHPVTGKKTSIPVTRLQKPKIGRAGTDPESVEKQMIGSLDGQIKRANTSGKGITMNVNGKIYKGVHGIKKTTETDKNGRQVKSDAHLHDQHGNPLAHISLKAGSKVSHFQQAGGITNELDHPHVKAFLGAFDKEVHKSGGSIKGRTLAAQLPTHTKAAKSLAHRALFGADAGASFQGPNNVGHVIQGPLSLRREGAHHVLHAAAMFNNGEIPHKMMIYGRHAEGRNDAGRKNTRFGIGFVGSRKVTDWVGK